MTNMTFPHNSIHPPSHSFAIQFTIDQIASCQNSSRYHRQPAHHQQTTGPRDVVCCCCSFVDSPLRRQKNRIRIDGVQLHSCCYVTHNHQTSNNHLPSQRDRQPAAGSTTARCISLILRLVHLPLHDMISHSPHGTMRLSHTGFLSRFDDDALGISYEFDR